MQPHIHSRRDRYLIWAMCFFTLLIVTALPTLAEPGGAEKGNGKILGEVVDLACYMDHAAKGTSHVKCVQAGGCAAVLTAEKDLYLLIDQHKPGSKQFHEYVGKWVEVTGTWIKQGGIKIMQTVPSGDGKGNGIRVIADSDQTENVTTRLVGYRTKDGRVVRFSK